MDSMIQFSDVTKRFGQHIALDNVSFSVPSGVVFALLGENGAGKTTSIRTMLGLERPTQGEVTVLGSDSRKAGTEIRRQVGYVPDQPALYDWMTPAEIGWFAAGFYPRGYQTEFDKLLEQFEVPPDRRIKKLSKGMRAKVSLALAMAHQPQLLILDEPTSGLDTLVRRRFLESMVDVAADNRTVFLSSHQIPEVERVADIVAIMHAGRLILCQPLEQLKSRIEQWTVSLAEVASALPQLASSEMGLGDLEAQVVEQSQTGRRVRLTVIDPSDDWLWRLRNHTTVAELEVHVPSLEELFVLCLEQGDAMHTFFSGPAPETTRLDSATDATRTT